MKRTVCEERTDHASGNSDSSQPDAQRAASRGATGGGGHGLSGFLSTWHALIYVLCNNLTFSFFLFFVFLLFLFGFSFWRGFLAPPPDLPPRPPSIYCLYGCEK